MPLSSTRIYVDADACPVKEEVYRVARRLSVPVAVVANARMRVPDEELIELTVVGDAIDAADDWIAERAKEGDVVVTADILLAARCLERGARVVSPTGRAFDAESIGDVVATRALMAELRERGEARGGPPPFDPKDRSRFLQTLDQALRPRR